MPDDTALHDIDLPHARAEVAARHHLDILVLGGGEMVGKAAEDESWTVPARLQARLQQALQGVQVRVVTRAAPHRTARASLHDLDADLSDLKPQLVIWSAGSSEAGRGSEVDTLADSLQAGIAQIREAGADVLLVDLQYAPSIARIVDLEPYRDAILRVGEAEGVPVLDRYELMRAWSTDGLLDLDAREPAARVQVARTLFDCVAAALSDPIAAAVSAPP